jgi:DNA-binding transcriptional LysR family regulator
MLFDHKGRKLELTPQGEIFYVEARKALNSVEEAKEKTKNHAAEFSGKISLAAPALPALFLSAELCPLPRRIPCHQIKYSGQEPRRGISMARSGDADLAMELFPHSFVDLEEIPLITPKLTLIIPRRGVRFTFRQIGLKELSQ